MNETRSHFIAVCPKCSASQMVDLNHLGEFVRCEQCTRAFRAGGANGAATESTGERLIEPASQSPGPVDRIAVVCPGCQATLNVRCAYIGNQVRCNHCDQAFVVTDQAQPQARPAVTEPETISVMTLPPMGDKGDHPGTGAEYQQLRTKHDRLQGEHEQLHVVYNLLEANHGRLQAECDRLAADLGRVSAELETIRAGLGTISPQEVRPLAEERESLRSEVGRLRDEIEALRAEEPTRDQMAAELEQRNGELAAARAERDLLARELEERDEHLKDARAELGRSAEEQQNARHEIDQLRTSLAERDQTMRNEGDQLRAVVESLHQALELAERAHADSNGTAQHAITPRPENANLVMTDPSSDADLQAPRAEVEDLKQRLQVLERLNREMSTVLWGIGIRDLSAT